MKVVAFVPVRLSSSRLPEKHLKKIGDKTLLEWNLLSLLEVDEIDEIVLAVPYEEKNLKLKEFLKNFKKKYKPKKSIEIFFYKGDIDDVVGRLTQAAKKYKADICILASGDCPRFDKNALERLITSLKISKDKNIVYFDEKNSLEGIMVCKREVWEIGDKYSDTKELREHQFPVFRYKEEARKFLKPLILPTPNYLKKVIHRMSIDTPSDLEFHNKVYEELKKEKKAYSLKNILKLLEKKPELKNINAHVYQKGLYDKTFYIYIPPFIKEKEKIVKDLIEKKGFGIKEFKEKVFYITPYQENIYDAFPTYEIYKDNLFLYFRRGIKDKTQIHGKGGKVFYKKIPLDLILDGKEKDILNIKENLAFESENELDAILSNPKENVYTLATRKVINGKHISFLSISDSPIFKDRKEIKIKDLEFIIFYGKVIYDEKFGYILPAYGTLKGENKTRPIFLFTRDFENFDYSFINDDEGIFNESSIVKYDDKFYIFTRRDDKPYGIYLFITKDFLSFEKKKLFFEAQAPMALKYKNDILFSYRYLPFEDTYFLALSVLSSYDKKRYLIDIYYKNNYGNIFDGAYSDLKVLNSKIFMTYYLSNKEGDTCIKGALINIEQ